MSESYVSEVERRAVIRDADSWPERERVLFDLLRGQRDQLDMLIVAARRHLVSAHDVLSYTRMKSATDARTDFVLMLRGRGLSYPECGKLLGRDHNTIIHLAKRRIAPPVVAIGATPDGHVQYAPESHGPTEQDIRLTITGVSRRADVAVTHVAVVYEMTPTGWQWAVEIALSTGTERTARTARGRDPSLARAADQAVAESNEWRAFKIGKGAPT